MNHTYHHFMKWLGAKHPKIKCLGKCIYNLKKDDFVQDILGGSKRPALFTIHSYGDKNADKLIYLEEILSSGAGFFDQHRRLLETLCLCDILHAVPVVHYSTNFTYYETGGVNGVYNGFEYYFEPLSRISYENVLCSKYVIKAQPEHRVFAWDNLQYLQAKCGQDYVSKYYEEEDPIRLDHREVYFKTLAAIQRKYIRLKPSVKELIYHDIHRLFGRDKVIGVHARGTDFKTHNKNCPVYVEPEIHMEEVRKVIDQYDKVFLATDNSESMELFKKAFGSKLICFDEVFRADGGSEGVHYMRRTNRECHKYLLGLEVLRDMTALSECDALVAGISGVSCMAHVNKLSQGKDYGYLRFINKGFYQ